MAAQHLASLRGLKRLHPGGAGPGVLYV
jgi:hypothetical protein